MSTEDEIKALKIATREAHEAAQELKDVIREAKAWYEKLEKAAEIEVDARLKPYVESAVAGMGEATEKAMRESVNKVISEFDKLSDTLMGRDKRSKRTGKSSIVDLIERANS